MYGLLTFVLYGVVIFIMGKYGITEVDWGFWAICTSAVAISVMGHSGGWKAKERSTYDGSRKDTK